MMKLQTPDLPILDIRDRPMREIDFTDLRPVPTMFFNGLQKALIFISCPLAVIDGRIK